MLGNFDTVLLFLGAQAFVLWGAVGVHSQGLGLDASFAGAPPGERQQSSVALRACCKIASQEARGSQIVRCFVDLHKTAPSQDVQGFSREPGLFLTFSTHAPPFHFLQLSRD